MSSTFAKLQVCNSYEGSCFTQRVIADSDSWLQPTLGRNQQIILNSVPHAGWSLVGGATFLLFLPLFGMMIPIPIDQFRFRFFGWIKSRLTMLQGFAVQWTPNPWDKVLRLILTCLQDQLQIERLLCQKLSEFSHASCSRPGWISGFNLDVSPIAFHAQVEYMLSWTWTLSAVATTVLIRWRPTIQARFGEIRP
jgi:hypothetical protein